MPILKILNKDYQNDNYFISEIYTNNIGYAESADPNQPVVAAVRAGKVIIAGEPLNPNAPLIRVGFTLPDGRATWVLAIEDLVGLQKRINQVSKSKSLLHD